MHTVYKQTLRLRLLKLELKCEFSSKNRLPLHFNIVILLGLK